VNSGKSGGIFFRGNERKKRGGKKTPQFAQLWKKTDAPRPGPGEMQRVLPEQGGGKKR